MDARRASKCQREEVDLADALCASVRNTWPFTEAPRYGGKVPRMNATATQDGLTIGVPQSFDDCPVRLMNLAIGEVNCRALNGHSDFFVSFESFVVTRL